MQVSDANKKYLTHAMRGYTIGAAVVGGDMGRTVGRINPLGFSLAVVAVVLSAQPAVAYTLQRNNYPGSPVGCTNVSPYWCIEWPLAGDGNSSITYVYLHSSLSSNNPGETLNMKQEARNAFARWNAVPAREPFLVEVTSITQSSGDHTPYWCPTEISRDSIGGYIAITTDYTPYDILQSGSHNTIECSQMIVSRDLNFDTNSNPNDGYIDARFTLGHEQGHMLCLGHTGHVAIMYPSWPNSVYMGITPTSDDVLGLQVAYGAS